MTRPLPRHVNAFTAKGKRYYYFRRPGMKPIRLPDFGTPEFEVAYQKALHGDAPEIGASRTLPGTLNEAVVSYYKSLAIAVLLAKPLQIGAAHILTRLRQLPEGSRRTTPSGPSRG